MEKSLRSGRLERALFPCDAQFRCVLVRDGCVVRTTRYSKSEASLTTQMQAFHGRNASYNRTDLRRIYGVCTEIPSNCWQLFLSTAVRYSAIKYSCYLWSELAIQKEELHYLRGTGHTGSCFIPPGPSTMGARRIRGDEVLETPLCDQQMSNIAK